MFMDLMVSQADVEQKLAAQLYQFGLALAGDDDHELLKRLHEEIFDSLNALIKFESFMHLASIFKLDIPCTKLLAIAYIFAIEPEILAPYLKSVWYEHGPAISFHRAVSLISSIDDKVNIPHFLNSNLYRWQLISTNTAASSGISSILLDDVLLAYLSGKSGNASTQLQLTSQEEQAYAFCYRQQFSAPLQKLIKLESDYENEALSLVLSLAHEHGYKYCTLLKVDYELSEPNLRYQLRNLALNDQKAFIYWPQGLELCSQSGALMRVLHEWQDLEMGILVCDNVAPQDMESDYQRQILSTLSHIDPLCFGQLKLEERARIWKGLCVQENGGRLTEDAATYLAQLYPLPPSQINEICQQELRCESKLKGEQLMAHFQSACIKQYQSSHPDLATLASPKASWQDMIMSPLVEQQLTELLYRLRYRHTLQAQVPNIRPGIQALFWGKPGTGKSMAAEAIADELKLPLYKVNLANVASKWIGESEKHLAKLFDQAEKQNAILLFDEADAIFAKRSEVESSQDKNANMGVSYLLQRMENYQGLLLLSTNFKGNLDDAFLRRFHSVIEFTLPDKSARLSLWQKTWQDCDKIAPDINLQLLAEVFEFSHAQIANVAETTLLFCIAEKQPKITLELLARAILRELDKQNAGYLASQKVNQWIQKQSQGADHGSSYSG